MAKNVGANRVASTMIATCPHRQSNPCEVTKNEDPLREEAWLLPHDISPSLACKRLVHGILGKKIVEKSLNA